MQGGRWLGAARGAKNCVTNVRRPRLVLGAIVEGACADGVDEHPPGAARRDHVPGAFGSGVGVGVGVGVGGSSTAQAWVWPR